MKDLKECELQSIECIEEKLISLTCYLNEHKVNVDESSIDDWFSHLSKIKEIRGNMDHDVSFVACLMAKRYLMNSLPMRDFDVGCKRQGAKGLDIEEETSDGKRVIAEIKTTVPYHEDDRLGSQQLKSFENDFRKLNDKKGTVDHRFFFVTCRRTFDILEKKYRSKIQGVKVVLLPSEEDFVA